tara:strand:- start:397 stop:570 length:174 start_codon:yes stop_codon:yes gene_type:complete
VKYYCRKEQNIEYKHRKLRKGAVCVRIVQDQLWIYNGSGFSSKVLHPAKNVSVELAE